MFNCFKKYLLIVIFFGTISSAYAMENSQTSWRWTLNALTCLWYKLPSIPSTLWGWKIRKKAENSHDEILQILQTDLNNGWCLSIKQNWKKIETYLLQKTNLNPIIDADKISLLLSVALAHEKPDINTIKILIKQGADVNKYRFNDKALTQINNWAHIFGYTALAQAIDISLNTSDFQIIQELCNAGASITNINNFGGTAFHRMATLEFPKEAFEIVLTHAYPKKINQQKEADLQNKGKYLSLVESRIKWFKEILKMESRYGTAAQILSNTSQQKRDHASKNEILSLIDGSKLDKDYEILVQNPNLLNPDYLTKNPEKAQEAKQNLAWRIADNIKELNAKKMLDFNIPD